MRLRRGSVPAPPSSLEERTALRSLDALETVLDIHELHANIDKADGRSPGSLKHYVRLSLKLEVT